MDGPKKILLRDTPDLEKHFAAIGDGETAVFLKPHGAEGIKITLRAMRFFVEREKQNPEFIRFVHGLVRQVPAKNKLQEAYLIYEWVRKNFRYEKDPSNIELVIAPFRNLKEFKGSDCDCQSTFVAAALEVIGIPTRFVAVKVAKSPRYSHVYTEAYINYQWVPIDTTTSLTRFGEEYSKITGKMYWPEYREKIAGKIKGFFAGIDDDVQNINNFVVNTGKIEFPELSKQINKKFISRAIQDGLGIDPENAELSPWIILLTLGTVFMLLNKKK